MYLYRIFNSNNHSYLTGNIRRVRLLIPDTAPAYRNSFCNLNSKSACNCFCNRHCICLESATATITALSLEAFEDTLGHRNSHCNLNSKSSCNCFGNRYCISFESATATITAPSTETVAESVTAENQFMMQ